MITAAITVNRMYRGSSFILAVIVEDSQGAPYVIPDTAVGKLRLAHSWTDSESLLELEASHYARDLGLMHFTFAPQDTKEFLAKAYDLSVHLEDGDAVYPVLQERFGIVAFNPGVV